MKNITTLLVGLLFIVFSCNLLAEKNHQKYIEVIFKKKSFVSSSGKFDIAENLTSFGKKGEDGSSYIVENGNVVYEDITLKKRDKIDYRVDELDLNNDGVYEVFVVQGCPTYLCGIVASYIRVFYQIDGRYRRVFSNNVAGYAIDATEIQAYPNLLFMGRGIECSVWLWNNVEKKYSFVETLEQQNCNVHEWR